MKTFYTLIILLSSVLVCFSQTTKISGSICIDTCPDSKMAGALVKYTKSLATEVLNSGTFELGLQPKTIFPIGLTVEPLPKYRNFVVINKFEIDNVNEHIPVNIKMCEETKLDSLRAIWAEINIDRLNKEKEEKIRKLEEEIDTLQKQNKEYQSKIKELEDLKLKYQELEKYAKETAEKLSIAEIENQMLKNNPNYLSNTFLEKYNNQKSIQQKGAKQGDIETVIKNYTTQEEVDEHFRRGEYMKDKLLSDIGYQRLFGQYKLAIDNYYNILKFETDNKYKFLYNYEAAELCYLTNDFQKADYFINAALDLKQYVNKKYLIKTYNLSGQIKNAIRENKYHNEYQESIKIYEQLKKKTLADNKTRKEAAISYTLLGIYYKEKGRNEVAKTNYHKALDIYTELNRIGEFEVESQCLVLLKLAMIYSDENEVSMVKKCDARITLLERKDTTILKSPKINMERAISNMKSKRFEVSDKYYTRAFEYYKENQSQNLYQQKLIEILFLSGLNQFYAKSYYSALVYFGKADSLLLIHGNTLPKKDSVRLTALCKGVEGITMIKLSKLKHSSMSTMEMEEIEKQGLEQYNLAREMIEKDKNLDEKYKKILLKNMAYLKNYQKLRVMNYTIGGALAGGFIIILFLPLML